MRDLAAVAVLLLGSLAASGAALAADAAAALEALRGRVTYVDFWASWCTPCAQSFPWLNRMQDKFADKGLRIVGVGLDEQLSRAQRFLQAHPANFSIIQDPDGLLAERFGVEGMPYAVLLDAEGRILHRHVGFRPAQQADYESVIESALAQPPGKP
jgi:cytochrome c biogenesis protein CcmG, thiol:disulfide interchange protein DsbE